MWGLCARVVLAASLVFTWAWSVHSAWSCKYGSQSLCSHTLGHSKSGSQCQLQYIHQWHNQVKIVLETRQYLHSLSHISNPVPPGPSVTAHPKHMSGSPTECIGHLYTWTPLSHYPWYITLPCLWWFPFPKQGNSCTEVSAVWWQEGWSLPHKEHRVENASGITMGAWTSVFSLLYILFHHCPASTHKRPPPPCTHTLTLHLAPEGSLGKKWSVQGPLCQY